MRPAFAVGLVFAGCCSNVIFLELLARWVTPVGRTKEAGGEAPPNAAARRPPRARALSCCRSLLTPRRARAGMESPPPGSALDYLGPLWVGWSVILCTVRSPAQQFLSIPLGEPSGCLLSSPARFIPWRIEVCRVSHPSRSKGTRGRSQDSPQLFSILLMPLVWHEQSLDLESSLTWFTLQRKFQLY